MHRLLITPTLITSFLQGVMGLLEPESVNNETSLRPPNAGENLTATAGRSIRRGRQSEKRRSTSQACIAVAPHRRRGKYLELPPCLSVSSPADYHRTSFGTVSTYGFASDKTCLCSPPISSRVLRCLRLFEIRPFGESACFRYPHTLRRRSQPS